MKFSLLFNSLHASATLVAALIGWTLGSPVFGAWIAVVFFISRELTQAEYKWIGMYGKGLRKNMPWWGCFDPRVWDAHSFAWNLAAPIVVAAVVSGGFA